MREIPQWKIMGQQPPEALRVSVKTTGTDNGGAGSGPRRLPQGEKPVECPQARRTRRDVRRTGARCLPRCSPEDDGAVAVEQYPVLAVPVHRS
ncbi:hypothetical protein GCM10027174_43140 [Salinifilum aidingensis]